LTGKIRALRVDASPEDPVIPAFPYTRTRFVVLSAVLLMGIVAPRPSARAQVVDPSQAKAVVNCE
jgi:hypothetical protein